MTKAGCSVLLVPGLLQAAAQVVDPHVLEAQQLLQPSHFHLQDLSGVQPSARPALSPVPSPTRHPPDPQAAIRLGASIPAPSPSTASPERGSPGIGSSWGPGIHTSDVGTCQGSRARPGGRD